VTQPPDAIVTAAQVGGLIPASAEISIAAGRRQREMLRFTFTTPAL